MSEMIFFQAPKQKLVELRGTNVSETEPLGEVAVGCYVEGPFEGIFQRYMELEKIEDLRYAMWHEIIPN